MANYHFVYKDVEGALTQWDDIQRKLGNLPPKPPTFKPPSFKPTENKDSKHKDKACHRECDYHRRLRLSVKFSLSHFYYAPKKTDLGIGDHLLVIEQVEVEYVPEKAEFDGHLDEEFRKVFEKFNFKEIVGSEENNKKDRTVADSASKKVDSDSKEEE
ncbi:hypothetical protein LOK49_LG01G01185 [Camellia lanceoleosa]|uniref:Uncharacterized protein n=1 Tax=Camellia lanceoleosa TaxID=1840588 RepID=A0ACC0J251_9ERIC|nr:hypothetical protein LOK49_LG01G01185 [Camellia lanceoleosa]